MTDWSTIESPLQRAKRLHRPLVSVDSLVGITERTPWHASVDRSGEAGETRSEAEGLDPKDRERGAVRRHGRRPTP